MKLMKQSYTVKTGNKYFDEDYYAYLYRNYDVPEAFGSEYLCLSKAVCNYLGNTYGSNGNKPFGYALKDEQVPVSLRYRIRDFEERDKIKIDGKIFDNHRNDIEDYALEKICREEITFDNFVEQYNALLKENDVPLETKLYYIDTNLGARRNKYKSGRGYVAGGTCQRKQKVRKIPGERNLYLVSFGCGRGIAGDYCGNTGISAQNFCDSRAWMCDSGYGHWYAVCLDFVAVEEKRSKNIRKSGNPNAKGKQKVWKTVPEAYGNI